MIAAINITRKGKKILDIKRKEKMGKEKRGMQRTKELQKYFRKKQPYWNLSKIKIEFQKMLQRILKNFMDKTYAKTIGKHKSI